MRQRVRDDVEGWFFTRLKEFTSLLPEEQKEQEAEFLREFHDKLMDELPDMPEEARHRILNELILHFHSAAAAVVFWKEVVAPLWQFLKQMV